MTPYLLEHQNANGPFFYTSRRNEVSLGVIHTAEILPDLVVPDLAGERVARYASLTTRAVSWHDTSDSDSNIFMLPYSYTAFHVRGYNSRSVGDEQATRANAWTSLPPDHIDGMLRQLAIVGQRWIEEFDLPIRRITKAQADAGQKGFIAHGDLDPGRRTDPGAHFPWSAFLALLAGETGGIIVPPPVIEDKEHYKVDGLLQFGDHGTKVRDWQRDLLRWSENALPEYGPDEDFGGETHEWTREFQKYAGILDDGIVGPETRGKMGDAQSGRLGITPGTYDLPSYPGRILRATTRGAHAGQWQRALNAWRSKCVRIDKVYGPITARWTTLFQGEYGLKRDGIVGPVTWDKAREILN